MAVVVARRMRGSAGSEPPVGKRAADRNAPRVGGLRGGVAAVSVQMMAGGGLSRSPRRRIPLSVLSESFRHIMGLPLAMRALTAVQPVAGPVVSSVSQVAG